MKKWIEKRRELIVAIELIAVAIGLSFIINQILYSQLSAWQKIGCIAAIIFIAGIGVVFARFNKRQKESLEEIDGMLSKIFVTYIFPVALLIVFPFIQFVLLRTMDKQQNAIFILSFVFLSIPSYYEFIEYCISKSKLEYDQLKRLSKLFDTLLLGGFLVIADVIIGSVNEKDLTKDNTIIIIKLLTIILTTIKMACEFYLFSHEKEDKDRM